DGMSQASLTETSVERPVGKVPDHGELEARIHPSGQGSSIWLKGHPRGDEIVELGHDDLAARSEGWVERPVGLQPNQPELKGRGGEIAVRHDLPIWLDRDPG